MILETRRSGWCRCRRTPPQGRRAEVLVAPCVQRRQASKLQQRKYSSDLTPQSGAAGQGLAGGARLAGCIRQTSSAIPHAGTGSALATFKRKGEPSRDPPGKWMISRELDETRDQASAQSLLGREVPAAVGATSDLFRIHVRAVDQLSEPSLFQAQSVVNVGNHLLEHPPATAQRPFQM